MCSVFFTGLALKKQFFVFFLKISARSADSFLKFLRYFLKKIGRKAADVFLKLFFEEIGREAADVFFEVIQLFFSPQIAKFVFF